jgi:predicted site-specific integrase-resolvase
MPMEGLTSSEVISALRISERTLYRWIRKGRISPVGKKRNRGAASLFNAARVAELQRAMEVLK